MGFNIISWNINGLRSFGNHQKWNQIFCDFNGADIICFQETKISRINMERWMSLINDYTSYFSFPTAANHLIKQTGYSGVASFLRESSNCRPWAVEVSFIDDINEIFDYDSFDESEEDLKFRSRWPMFGKQGYSLTVPWNQVDSEGRCIVSKHQIRINNDTSSDQRWLHIFNVYCPRNDPTRPERELYQLKFYHLVQKRVFDLLRQPTNHVIIVGDFNTAHQPIDVYCDQDFGYSGSNSRKWLSELLDGSIGFKRKLYDAFRCLHPDARNEFTCWNTLIGGRETNYGSRIDYIIIDDLLYLHLVECYHLSEFKGSDHCPVIAKFDDRIKFISPPLDHYSQHCTKLWPEFSTKAGSIRTFLTLKEKKNDSNVNPQDGPKDVKKNKLFSQPKISTFLTGIKKISKEKSIENSSIVSCDQQSFENNSEVSNKWRQLFSSKEIPVCSGHHLPCIRRKVRKPGPNHGREFYLCPKPSIKPVGHPETRCNFFRWVSTRNHKNESFRN